MPFLIALFRLGFQEYFPVNEVFNYPKINIYIYDFYVSIVTRIEPKKVIFGPTTSAKRSLYSTIQKMRFLVSIGRNNFRSLAQIALCARVGNCSCQSRPKNAFFVPSCINYYFKFFFKKKLHHVYGTIVYYLQIHIHIQIHIHTMYTNVHTNVHAKTQRKAKKGRQNQNIVLFRMYSLSLMASYIHLS